MQVMEYHNGVLLYGDTWFDAGRIFDCGQNFRFTRGDDGIWRGVAFDHPLAVASRSDGSTFLFPCTMREYQSLWRGYFDMDRNYEALTRTLAASDEHLAQAARYCRGMRLTRQARFETLISFVISANNNIGRIRGILQRLCCRYGAPLEAPWPDAYAFPAPQTLAKAPLAALRELGMGYRDRYVSQCAARVAENPQCLDAIAALPLTQARRALCAFAGVGAKVADCVLLFSMDKRDAFPQDVWIRRVAQEQYGLSGAALAARFGAEAGYAQQMLFYAARMQAAGKKEERR